MKYLLLLISFLFSLSAMSQQQTTLNNLEPLTWENRIILVFSEQADKYQAILQESQAQIDDRDIVWFIINGNQTKTNYRGKISDRFATDLTSQFSRLGAQVILIGKDGGVKQTSDLLSLDSLFDEIDSMAMRIREMEEKRRNLTTS